MIGRSTIDGSEIYRIDYDPARNLLTSICQGFWTPEDIGPYRTTMVRYIKLGHAKHGMIRCLIDRRECPVQVGEVVRLIREAVADTVLETDRFALVVNSALVRMQAQRTFERKRTQAFEETEPAMTWLLSDE